MIFVPVQELVRTGLVVGGTSCSFRLWADAAVMKPQRALFAARVWISDVTHQPGESVAITAEGPQASGGLRIPSSAINGHLFWIRAAGAVGALPKEEGVRSTWDKLPIHHTGCTHTFPPRANSASALAAMGLREGSYPTLDNMSAPRTSLGLFKVSLAHPRRLPRSRAVIGTLNL